MTRTPDHPIEPLFVERWSPRSFSGEAVPDDVLLSLFEAARWAPSAFNAQPWRFIFARPGEPQWGDFFDLLVPLNQLWAANASALIVILSAREVERSGEVVANVSHSFDTGAAWANLAHQATLLGWHTHGIGGFDRTSAHEKLHIPQGFAAEAMVALGRRADLDRLHPDFHEQESPNGRRPLTETVFAGRFGEAAFIAQRNAA